MTIENRDGKHSDSFVLNHVRHTGSFDGTGNTFDSSCPRKTETALGEDLTTTSNILDGLVNAGFDFEKAQKILAPRVIAGIKSERDYRRQCHRTVKELGHITGRHLYGGIVHHDSATKMLREFVDASVGHVGPNIGLELGHCELIGSGVSPSLAWRKLDNMAEEVGKNIPFETIDAHDVPSSVRAALFSAEIMEDGNSREVKLPRARTNMPVLDIGRTGIQLFVRVAVGYETPDLSPMDLQDVRTAHDTYMRDHAETSGIQMIDNDILAYPLSATLVALQHND